MKSKQVYKLMVKNTSFSAVKIGKKEAKELNCDVGDFLIQPKDQYSHQIELPEFILDKSSTEEIFQIIKMEE